MLPHFHKLFKETSLGQPILFTFGQGISVKIYHMDLHVKVINTHGILKHFLEIIL